MADRTNLEDYIQQARAEGRQWQDARAERLRHWVVGSQPSLFNPRRRIPKAEEHFYPPVYPDIPRPSYRYPVKIHWQDEEGVRRLERQAEIQGLPLRWIMDAAIALARINGRNYVTTKDYAEAYHYARMRAEGTEQKDLEYWRQRGWHDAIERYQRMLELMRGEQPSLFNPAEWRAAAQRAAMQGNADADRAMLEFLRRHQYTPHWQAMTEQQRSTWARVWRDEYAGARRLRNPERWEESLPDGRVVQLVSHGSSGGIRRWAAYLHGLELPDGRSLPVSLDIVERGPRANQYAVFAHRYTFERGALGTVWPKRHTVMLTDWLPLREAKQRAIEILRSIRTAQDAERWERQLEVAVATNPQIRKMDRMRAC